MYKFAKNHNSKAHMGTGWYKSDKGDLKGRRCQKKTANRAVRYDAARHIVASIIAG